MLLGSAIFAQPMAECHRTGRGMLFPLKIAPSHGKIWTPSNTWFLASTRLCIANGIFIGSAVFAGLMAVTDRQTTLLGLQQ